VRRWLRGSLVCLLSFSLSLDTANACWFARRCGSASACRPVTCRPVRCLPACGPVIHEPCSPVSPCDQISGWDAPSCPSQAAQAWDSESICCGSHVVVERVVGSEIGTDISTGIDVGVVTEEPISSESSVLARPVEATPPQAAAITPSTQPTRTETVLPETALPTLQAVEPAAVAADSAVVPAPAVTPAVALDDDATPTVADTPSTDSPEPAPAAPESPADSTAEDIIAAARADAPEPTPPTPVTPAAKKADNIFEEFEDEPAPAAEPDEPAAAAEPVIPAEPAEAPATTVDDLFGSPAEPAEPAAADTEDAVEAPASAEDDEPEAPAQDEPESPAAAEPDPFDDVRHGPVESLRRWVDASGEHATVGTLVDLRGDAVEIRKANGRTVIVPLGRLSAIDRAYAAEAGARLAARTPAPQPTDTAGL
jgi:hypothetical protein